MLTPQQFAKRTGLSYAQVLFMCKKKEIDAIETNGGHYKIPESQLNKYSQPEEYVSKEEYEKVIRENERLKTLLNQFKNFVFNLEVES